MLGQKEKNKKKVKTANSFRTGTQATLCLVHFFERLKKRTKKKLALLCYIMFISFPFDEKKRTKEKSCQNDASTRELVLFY